MFITNTPVDLSPGNAGAAAVSLQTDRVTSNTSLDLNQDSSGASAVSLQGTENGRQYTDRVRSENLA